MDSNDYRKLLEAAPALNVPTLDDKCKFRIMSTTCTEI